MSTLGESKPYLVQRLLYRRKPHEKADSIFRHWGADYMGAAEFEHGILNEALIEACKVCHGEFWTVHSIIVSDDIVIHYVGPSHRFKSAVDFLQTQFIEDGSDRYMAERPLKETTYLRQAYLCKSDHFKKFSGWWRLDLGQQFFFFKDKSDAELCLATLQTTDWKSLLG